MPLATYRIESAYPIVGPLLPYLDSARSILISVRELAVTMAAKSGTHPSGHEIRVVHVPTGEVIFRKTEEFMSAYASDFEF